jgi:hypothetical protein
MLRLREGVGHQRIDIAGSQAMSGTKPEQVLAQLRGPLLLGGILHSFDYIAHGLPWSF